MMSFNAAAVPERSPSALPTQYPRARSRLREVRRRSSIPLVPCPRRASGVIEGGDHHHPFAAARAPRPELPVDRRWSPHHHLTPVLDGAPLRLMAGAGGWHHHLPHGSHGAGLSWHRLGGVPGPS